MGSPVEIEAATVPTMYFIGVTTGASSSVRVFPRWAEALGLGECRLAGLDFAVHDDPARYRSAIEQIKTDPLSLGALVTTHKMDLLAATRGLFDELDPLADEMGEVSSIFKRDDGSLCGRTVDPYTGGQALDLFLPAGHFADGAAEVLVLGAGGSSLALVWHFLRGTGGAGCPAKIHVANRSQPRLQHLRALAAGWGGEVIVEPHLVSEPGAADSLVSRLPAGSLVVNATGLGKDAPGSPLSDAAQFPEKGFAWEFNYRGELTFLRQAEAQREARGLTIEDGWRYFVLGWSQVIGDVFHIDVPAEGEGFEALSEIAAEVR